MNDCKILVVEDNVVNQRVITSMLSNCGYESDIAANGLEALTAIDRGDYEIILMDCGMPEMDGFEATKEIRKKEAGSDKAVTIVALTAHAFDEVKDRCDEAGMDDFLTKPLQLKTIKELLDRLMPEHCKPDAK